MNAISKIQFLGHLLDDLPSFHARLKTISFDMECRVSELKELQVPHSRQADLLTLLRKTKDSLEELEFFLHGYI